MVTAILNRSRGYWPLIARFKAARVLIVKQRAGLILKLAIDKNVGSPGGELTSPGFAAVRPR